MATHIEYTPSSSPSGIQQTISFWLKKPETDADQTIFEARQNSTNMSKLTLHNDDKISIYSENGGTTNVYLRTTRKLRDVNAWYHIVYAIDTSQSTAADRIKLYINGVQETSFSTNTQPSQNYDNFWYGIAQKQVIGRDNQGSGSEDFTGVLSHFHYSRGYVYQASTFGSTDATTGEWKINTNPTGVNYGATGWFILKDGNSVTDQSGNGNNFTVGSGTLTKTEDNPSNVFATLNPLCVRNQIAGSANLSYANGNTTHTNTNTSYSSYNVSTLGMQGSGKYYCEFKINTLGGSSDSERFGISNLNNLNNYPFGSSSGYSYNKDGNATPSGSGFPTYTTNDIIGVAFDAGNGNMWFSKNGTWINSATISEIAAGTTTNAVFTGISTSETWHFSGATYSNGSISANFGNGYFGTTAVASAGTNASNNGIFEYDVPSGYTALSTKGLNT